MSLLKVRNAASFTNYIDPNANCSVIISELQNRDGIVYTFPNVTATITANNVEQTLINRTITGNTNFIDASALQTTGAAVNVSNATPPLECSFLKALTPTEPEWLTLDPCGVAGLA